MQHAVHSTFNRTTGRTCVANAKELAYLEITSLNTEGATSFCFEAVFVHVTFHHVTQYVHSTPHGARYFDFWTLVRMSLEFGTKKHAFITKVGLCSCASCSDHVRQQRGHIGRWTHTHQLSLPPLYISLLRAGRIYFLNLGVKGWGVLFKRTSFVPPRQKEKGNGTGKGEGECFVARTCWILPRNTNSTNLHAGLLNVHPTCGARHESMAAPRRPVLPEVAALHAVSALWAMRVPEHALVTVFLQREITRLWNRFNKCFIMMPEHERTAKLSTHPIE